MLVRACIITIACVLEDSHEALASRLVRFLLSRIINEQVCVCTYVVLQREEEEEQTEEEELEESPPSLSSCLLVEDLTLHWALSIPTGNCRVSGGGVI